MKINLNTEVWAKGADGSWIEKGDKTPLTLKDILLVSLRTNYQEDEKNKFKEKHELYLLEKKLSPEDFKLAAITEVELTPEETNVLKERVGRVFLQSNIVGIVGELLDGTF